MAASPFWIDTRPADDIFQVGFPKLRCPVPRRDPYGPAPAEYTDRCHAPRKTLITPPRQSTTGRPCIICGVISLAGCAYDEDAAP